MKTHTAFLFPGQGSQSIGMGSDLYRRYDSVREIFETAARITGLPVAQLCFEGPLEELTRTVHLQPALTAVSLAFLSVLEAEGAAPGVVAGHSLGEYCALRAAGVLDTEDTFRLVHRRGVLMHRESQRHRGAMSALIGLPVGVVEEIVREGRKSGAVSVANHNAETQIVITGEPAAVAETGRLAAARGAKAIPLKVSGAWHSELIRGAEDEFAGFLAGIPFREPKIPVVHNVTARESGGPEEIRSLMARQLCSPVRWYETLVHLIDSGVRSFVEVGPGKVLTGLVRKTLPPNLPATVHTLNSMEALEDYLEKSGGF